REVPRVSRSRPGEGPVELRHHERDRRRAPGEDGQGLHALLREVLLVDRDAQRLSPASTTGHHLQPTVWKPSEPWMDGVGVTAGFDVDCDVRRELEAVPEDDPRPGARTRARPRLPA